MLPGSPPAVNIYGLSKEDAYNKIELEISRLKDQIRSLHSIRNTISSVSSLPNELLAKVFMHCCDFNESGIYSNIRAADGDKGNKPKPEMRLVVSWVTRHWRSVALQHKPLWNLVVNLQPSIHLDYVRACEERCQYLFLDLERPSPGLIEACIPKIDKTNYIVLNSCQDSAVNFTKHIWSQSAPLLQCLKLHSVHIRSGDTQKVNFLKLQSLTLIQCTFHWSFVSSLASISKLCISDPRRTIAISACVQLLSSLPLLIECTLHSCLKEDDGSHSPTPDSDRLRLPDLKQLTLGGSVAYIIQLLRDIDIRHTHTELHLVQNQAEPTNNDLDAVELFSALRESQGDAWGPMRCLQVRRSFTVVNTRAAVKHRIHVPGTNSDLLHLHACQILDLSVLESLWTFSLSPEVLQIYSRLTQLHRVVLESSGALERFILFLSSESDSYDDASKVPFPALKELVLVNLYSEEWLEELRDILVTRKVWGFDLQKLVLYKCDTLGIGEIAQLRRVVDVEFGQRNLDDLLL